MSKMTRERRRAYLSVGSLSSLSCKDMASTVMPTVEYTKASGSMTSDQDMASCVELTEPSSKKADTLMTSMWENNDTAHCFMLP